MVLEAANNGGADAIVTHNLKDFQPARTLGITNSNWRRYTRSSAAETRKTKDVVRYKYPLNLPASLKEEAARLARNDGVSLNQWITAAVAQKIGAVETAARPFARRAANAEPGDLQRHLKRVPNVPPVLGEELPDTTP